MKAMKRGVLFLLTAVLFLSVGIFLAACGNNVTLTFHTDGGSGADKITAERGTSVELPVPEKAGFLFAGWYLSEDLTGTAYTGTITVPEENTDYYAAWETPRALTLNTGDYGTLSSTVLTLKAGDSVYDAVKDVVPAVKADFEGVTFGAWFYGNTELTSSSSLKMPAGDLTLNARYKVEYTSRYFLEDLAEGNYTADPTLESKGSDYIGSEVRAEVKTKEGFTPASIDQSRTSLTLSATASANVLRTYLRRARYTVRYDANPPEGLPEGVGVEGTTGDTSFRYGEDVGAKECGFTLEGYRFLGWSLTATGDPEILPGGALGNTNRWVYAVWQKGLTDAMGGSDYLFPEGDKIYFRRAGFEDIEGAYNEAEGSFSVPDGNGGVLLAGRVDGEQFYYYDLRRIGEYRTADGAATLSVKEGGKVVLTESGVSHEGDYFYDIEHDLFEVRTAAGERFAFRFGENGSFVLQDEELAGYYATEGGYPVIYLDGMGRFTYYFDPENYKYVDYYTRLPILIAHGSYEWSEEKGQYIARDLSANDYVLEEEFAFRFTEEKPAPVAGYTLKDKAIERTEFYGRVVRDDAYELTDELVFESFDTAYYFGRPGKYEVLNEWWMTPNGNEASYSYLIRLVCDDDPDTYRYYGIQQDRNGNYDGNLFATLSKDEEPQGYYPFDGRFVVTAEEYQKGFIFIFDGENSMVWGLYEERPVSGKPVDVYGCFYMGSVEPNERENGWRFTDSETGDMLNFVLSDGTATYDAETRVPNIKITENVEIDPNKGEAFYGGEKAKSYRYTPGYIDYCAVTLESGETHYYVRTDSAAEYYGEIPAADILDYRYVSEALANPYTARLLLDLERDIAYLATPMSGDDVWAFLGKGRIEKVEGTENEYDFELYEQDENILDYFGGDGYQQALETYLDDYSAFRFRKIDGEHGGVGEFLQRLEEFVFACENFTANGYGIEAVYTNEEGNKIEGTFEMLANIIVFTSEDGAYKYSLREDETANRVVVVSSEAALYYLYTADDVYFQTFGPDSDGYSSYIVLSGRIEEGTGGTGRVTIFDYPDGFNLEMREGTYKCSEDYKEDFLEFEVTEPKGIYRIRIGEYTDIWGGTYPIYEKKSTAREGDYEVEGGGKLHGDGYTLSGAWYETKEGERYSGELVRVEFDEKNITTHAYTEDEEGRTVVFNTVVPDPITQQEVERSFVFDIEDDLNHIVIERTLRFGAYALWETGKRTGAYLYLDGHGTAICYDADDRETGRGRYLAAPEIDESTYLFESNAGHQLDFYFEIVMEETDLETYFEYRVYNDDVSGSYTAEGLSSLVVGYYGEIEYVDRYGVRVEGYYSAEGNRITLFTYDGSERTFVFTVDKDAGTFEAEA